MTEFNENLRRFRKEKGLTQKEMADRLGINMSTYSRYETGNREPYVPMVKKMADILGVTGDELIGLDEGQDAPSEYYLSRRAAVYAEKMANNPKYQVLFDAAANVPPEDIDLVTQLIERFSEHD